MVAMERLTLREFIETSLVDIVKAVDAATVRTTRAKQRGGAELSPLGAAIWRSESLESCLSGSRELISQTTGILAEGESPVTHIEFDIAVVVSDTRTTEANAKAEGKMTIYVADAEASAGGAHKREGVRTDESRIKFSVPVAFSGRAIDAHKGTVIYREMERKRRKKSS